MHAQSVPSIIISNMSRPFVWRNSLWNEAMICMLYRSNRSRWIDKFASEGYPSLAVAIHLLSPRIKMKVQPYATVESRILMLLKRRRRGMCVRPKRKYSTAAVFCDACNSEGWCMECRQRPFVPLCSSCVQVVATWICIPCECRSFCDSCIAKQKRLTRCPDCSKWNSRRFKHV